MSNSIDTSTLLVQMREMARAAGVPDAGVRASGVAAPSVATPGMSRPLSGLEALADSRWSEDLGTVASTARRGDDVAFTDLFRQSIEGVNARNQKSRALTEAFEGGASDVELVDVMISVQKARVSFEALTQVRNKMIAAYKEIMSTPL